MEWIWMLGIIAVAIGCSGRNGMVSEKMPKKEERVADRR